MNSTTNKKNVLFAISPVAPFLLKGCKILNTCRKYKSRVCYFGLLKEEFPLDFEALIFYIMSRRGGLYDKSRYHLRSF